MSGITRRIASGVASSHINGGEFANRIMLSCDVVDCAAPTTVNPTANFLFTVPFTPPAQDCRAVFLCFQHQGAVAVGNCRAGLFESPSLTNIYPTNLLAQSGDISTNVGAVFQKVAIDIPIAANKRYWGAYVSSVLKNISGVPTTSQTPTFGGLEDPALSLAGIYGFNFAFAFGALPATFPAGLNPAASGLYPKMWLILEP